MNRQKKIALFVSHLFGNYQRNLCNGVVSRASEYGYCVDIFVSNDGETSAQMDLGEFGILDLPKYNEYRGVIFANGTYLIDDLSTQILNMVKSNCTCPIVNIEQNPSDSFNILIDNYNPMKELVTHLITIHKYEYICFIALKSEEIYSNQRIDAYKEVLSQFNIPIKDEMIYWLDYRNNSVEDAVNCFTSNRKDMPDAIVCYNDSIALELASVLKEKGILVPVDIAITGYDNLEYAQNNNPPITSVEFPVAEMGSLAVDKIFHSISGINVEPTTIIPAHPIIRGSCGCVNVNCKVDSNYNLKLIKKIAKREKSSIRDMNMATSLVNTTDIDDGMDVLETFVNCIDHLEGLYICLYNSWDSLSHNIKEITNYDEFQEDNSNITYLKFGIKHGKRVPECSFNSKLLLPEYIYKKTSSAYLYMPLYFKDKKFGYLAISYKDNLITYDFSFMSWLRNINNMLQRIRSNNELNLLVNRLEELYLKDELTNLYNTRGFDRLSKQMITTAELKELSLMKASFTLDNLDVIIQDYGYLEGEFALTVLARALKSSLSDSELCGRTANNEFTINALNYDENKASLFLDKITTYLSNYNTLYPKEYCISSSSSFHITFPHLLLHHD